MKKQKQLEEGTYWEVYMLIFMFCLVSLLA